ncbi:hypothetical protein [Polaromonas sp. SM01]|uniref:hypothetical protein n=1 Tax=Polaromonas sp. SM01 TaxID=3085630 RepID=UPI00298143C5|nr:hypothetical protein [Polaromonas sp. SM01]MDW5443374.1 hypothetical protein [Polaromonas sp. SM01]
MKSIHNKFRALGLGMGLALLMVTGTATLMAALSSAAPAANLYRPATATPALHPAQLAQGDDTLFYERIAGSDGGHQWVLITEPDARPAHTGPSIYAGGPTPVSYTLRAKPAGLNKAMRNCSRPRVYDIVCITLG